MADTVAGAREDREGAVEDDARIASGFAHIAFGSTSGAERRPILAAWDARGE